MDHVNFKKGLMRSGAFCVASLAAAWLVAAPAAALAQAAFEPAAGASGQAVNESATSLSDVVVTARKKSETLLDVPLAMTALPAAELAAKNVDSLETVAAYTPSLTVSSFGGSASNRSQQTLIIRGVTPGNIYSNTTTVFVNGAPLGASGLVDGISDLAQVEIIKGPQSAYFGRSTFGGAVNLITKRPSNDFKASVDALYGSYNWGDVKATVEGPLIKDKLTLRLSARLYSIDGQYDSSKQDYAFGAQKSKNISGELNFKPIDGLEIRLFGAFIRQDDGQSPLAKFKSSDFNCFLGGANFYCGTLPSLPINRLGANMTLPTGFIDKLKATPVRYKDLGLDHMGTAVENRIGNLIVNYDIGDTGLAFTSVSSGNKVYADSIFDLINEYSTDPAKQFPFDTFNLSEAYSQEFRLTSDQSKRLRGSVGYNWYYTHGGQTNMGQQNGLFSSFSPANVMKDTTQSVFGSVSFDVTPQLIVNLEGRYQNDNAQGYRRTAAADGGAVETKVAGLKDVRKAFLPRAIVQWKFAPRQQIYATYSRGMNPGVFNSAALAYNQATQDYVNTQSGGAGLSAKPEKMDNYEIGYKGALFDGRLQLDADVYYAKWTNQLISQSFYINNPALTGTTATIVINTYTNAGQTDLRGVEGAANWIATDNLRFSLSGAVNDSIVHKYTNAGAAALLGVPAPAPLDLYDGNQLANYSKYSANFGAAYERELTSDLNGFANLDVIYKSGMYESVGNFNKSAPTKRVNLRVGVDRDKQRFEFFVDNLFNNQAYSSVTNSIDLAGANARIIYGGLPLPRRFGVRMHQDF